MSAQNGRQSVEEFGKALKDVVDDLRALALGAGRAGKGLAEFTGASFAANTAMLAIQKMGRDIAFGTGEDVLRHGAGQFNNALNSNTLRALSGLPMDPFQAGELQRPIEASFNRLSGITGPIARAGGNVDDATRSQLADLLYDQERRAELDKKRNDALQLDFTSREIERRGGGQGSFMGIPSNPAAFFMRLFGMSAR